MIDVNLWNLAIGLFLSTTGMACLYTLLSFMVLFTGYKTIKGKELRNIVGILMYAMIVGFVYACWQFLLMFGILEPSEFVKGFVGNGLFISILFVIMFLSFSIRQTGKEQQSKTKIAKKLMKVGRQKSKRLPGFG